jgi:hypothetical protein
MAQYEAFDPAVEVHGQTILNVIDGALSRFSNDYQQLALDALAENGVENPKPEAWYPQQAWLDTFKTIADELEPHLLDRIGEQIPDVVDWPTGITGIEAGLEAIDEAYQLNHRGGEIGSYAFVRVDDRQGEMRCRNPYPCPFDRGLIRAVAREHAPVGAFVFIEERGEKCRQNGAEACTYTVWW